MRKPLIAGNWKMNGTREGVDGLVTAVCDASDDFPCDVVVCPPFVFLQQVSALIKGSAIGLGAQNTDWRSDGAFTGEISVGMLKEFGCQYVLVGHSERRALFQESDETVAEKYKAVCQAGLTPVLCVGETLEQRRASATEQVVNRQLSAVLSQVSAQELGLGVIAYEPVWAIGTGETATPDQVAEVHAGIRQAIDEKEAGLAERIRILYGGSVNAANAAGLLALDDIDGALVGGASLKSEEFIAICQTSGMS